MLLFGTQKIEQNELIIGGIPASKLRDEFQTPLWIMDEALIRDNCRMMKRALHSNEVDVYPLYASKAFLTLAMVDLIKEEGMKLDVVSGGELYTAKQAGYPMKDIFFHGNAKTIDELRMALDYGVGTIVLDNEAELDHILALVKKDQVIRLMPRINPGIVTNTHEYIRTTSHESKFGVTAFGEETFQLIKRMIEHPNVEFVGTHSHIGSQIFEEVSFLQHATAVMHFYKDIKERFGVAPKEVNLGGGFAVRYTENDPVLNMPELLAHFVQHTLDAASELGITLSKLYVEPGRSIVANAGITLYEVNATKTTYSGKEYVFIDGSMSDHIRTALYQAKYEAAVANRMNDEATTLYTIAGRACESGDMIIKDIKLPKVQEKDLIAVSTTGAYHYSMASNYNRFLKPAVVFVKDGKARVVVKRETYEDLLRNDLR